MKRVYLIMLLLTTINFAIAQHNTMVLKTLKNAGETIQLYIIPANASADVWVDFNNNGEQDANEGITSFGSFDNYPISAQTITIYGAIKEIYLFNNEMTELNTSNNPYLLDLRCSNNKLETLNVSGNNKLLALRCYNNKLKKLDLSKNLKITELYCYDNLLDSLDLSKQLLINTLSCYNNNIVSLALPAAEYSNLNRIGCFSNKLKGANVVSLMNSLPTLTPDNTSRLVIFNSQASPQDENLIYASHVNIAVSKNWKVLDYNGGSSIPYSGVDDSNIEQISPLNAKIWSKNGDVFISNEYNGKTAFIYSLDGKQVQSDKINMGIIAKNLNKGIYLLRIEDKTVKIFVN